jgi:DNA-binding transcriptional regulator GbsR (MarR family)
MDITKEREELIEMFGVHFETVHHLPPLGSRIFAILILDTCSRKTTFEDLVELTGASKSSVSTNLSLLVKMGKITYYTLPGDRKKYYKPSPFSERFDNYMKMIAFEKQIIDRMVRYRQVHMGCPEEELELQRTRTYQEHVLQMEEIILSTINKFKTLEEGER